VTTDNYCYYILILYIMQKNITRHLQLSVIISLIFLVGCKSEGDFTRYINKIKKLEYQGNVERKFVDKYEHNFLTIQLSNGRKLVLWPTEYYSIKTGDSLSKKKNSTILSIYRKNKLIKVDLRENIRFFNDKS